MKLHAPDIECRQAVELVSDYLDRSLSRRQRRRLERHLAGCPNCAAYLEQMRVTIALTGAIEPEDLDPEVLERLLDVFRKFHADPE